MSSYLSGIQVRFSNRGDHSEKLLVGRRAADSDSEGQISFCVTDMDDVEEASEANNDTMSSQSAPPAEEVFVLEGRASLLTEAPLSPLSDSRSLPAGMNVRRLSRSANLMPAASASNTVIVAKTADDEDYQHVIHAKASVSAGSGVTVLTDASITDGRSALVSIVNYASEWRAICVGVVQRTLNGYWRISSMRICLLVASAPLLVFLLLPSWFLRFDGVCDDTDSAKNFQIFGFISGMLVGIYLSWALFFYFCVSPIPIDHTTTKPHFDQSVFKDACARRDEKTGPVYKGWMNILNERYHPHRFHVNTIQTVLVRLDGNMLRISRPNRSLLKHAFHNDPTLTEAEPRMLSQNIYDLTNATVKLRPRRLARRRWFSRKYPICIRLLPSSKCVENRLSPPYGESRLNASRSTRYSFRVGAETPSRIGGSPVVSRKDVDATNVKLGELTTAGGLTAAGYLADCVLSKTSSSTAMSLSSLTTATAGSDSVADSESVSGVVERRSVNFDTVSTTAKEDDQGADDEEEDDGGDEDERSDASNVERRSSDVFEDDSSFDSDVSDECTEDAWNDWPASDIGVDDIVGGSRNRRKSLYARQMTTRRIFLFARSAREKERWFHRLRKATSRYLVKNSVSVNLTNTADSLYDVLLPPASSSAGDGKAAFRRRFASLPSINNGLDEEPASKNYLLYILTDLQFAKHIENILPGSAACRLAATEGNSGVAAMDLGRNKWSLPNRSPQNNDFIGVVNLLASRIFYDFCRDEYWIRAVQKKIQTKLATIHLPHFIETLELSNFDIGTAIPRIHNVYPAIIDDWGIWIDFEGRIQLVIETKVNLMKLKHDDSAHSGCGEDHHHNNPAAGNVPIPPLPPLTSLTRREPSRYSDDEIPESPETSPDEEFGSKLRSDEATSRPKKKSGQKWLNLVDKIAHSKYFKEATELKPIRKVMQEISSTRFILNVEITSLEGIMTVNMPTPPSDRLWYGFRKPPKMSLKAVPQVGDRSVAVSALSDWIKSKVQLLLEKNLVVPNLDDVVIPVQSGNILLRGGLNL